MRKLIVIAALAAAAAPFSAVQAQDPSPEEMTCPIGGKAFAFTPAGRQTAVGERPDGKPYGNRVAPAALPECPDNGLVFYKDYEPEEVAKLEPLVASEAYQALRQTDTQYYRAYWLMREMGVAPERQVIALVQAGWEADARPELRARYLGELAEASAAVEARPADVNWIAMEGRSINALRELGRFDEALARLDKLPMEALDAPTGSKAPMLKQWSEYLLKLRVALERKDASREPIDMIPRSMAYSRCIEGGDSLGDTDKAFCEKQSAEVEALRSRRAAKAKELETLRRSRESSGR